MNDFNKMFNNLNHAYKTYQKLSKETQKPNQNIFFKPFFEQDMLSKSLYNQIYPIDLRERLKSFLFREI